MKRRVCSIILCLAMLLTTVSLLTACSTPDGELVIDEQVWDIDLSKYALVYSTNLSADVRNQIATVATAMTALTTVPFRPDTDKEVEEVTTEDYEILVGDTYRTESMETLNSLGEVGWAIRVYEYKIVIVGTTNFLTRVALSYFHENFVNTEKVQGTVMTLNNSISIKNMGTVALLEGDVEDAIGAYSVVFPAGLDATEGSADFGTEPSGATVDYPVTVSNDVRADMAGAAGIRSNGFGLKQDNVEETKYEVLVGNVDRPEMQELLATLNADEYSLTIKDGKIMLAAWNDVTLARAYRLFKSMIQDSTIYDDDGNSTLLIPDQFSIKETLDKGWVTDFPRPESDGVKLVTTQDVSDGSHLYVYGGEGVSLDAYRAYCEKLESSKFVKYGPETNQEGSYFVTYINYSTRVNLRVSYFAYSHAEAQDVDNFTESIRIVANTMDAVELPDTDYYNSKQAYVKMTETAITSLKLDYKSGEFGMSYIITLEDGSFIVYDGGGISGGNTSQHKILWNVLNELYKKSHEGEEPDSSNPIHIRAWILTHEHMDHYMIFTKFCEEFGKNDKLRFDMLLANFASDAECYNVYNPESYVESNLASLQDKVRDTDGDGKGFDYIKVHTGEVFYMANAKMEVLYTHEDIWPQRMYYFNNSSTIFRITLDSTNGKGVALESHTTMWLGDLERVGSKCLRAMYGETLAADHVQVAHHGWNGVESELYALISPEVVWWPAVNTVYTQNALNANASAWYKKVDYFIANELPSVKIIIMADKYYTSMYLTKDGAQYAEDQLFNVGEDTAPVYDSNTIIYKGTV